MPQVNPITITVDTASVVMAPAGGNGNGSMSYRAPDQHQTVSISPRPGNGKTVPDRVDLRINEVIDVADHLDPSKTAERETFFRVSGTFPPQRDVDLVAVRDRLVEAIMSDQFLGAMKGETFW